MLEQALCEHVYYIGIANLSMQSIGIGHVWGRGECIEQDAIVEEQMSHITKTTIQSGPEELKYSCWILKCDYP